MTLSITDRSYVIVPAYNEESRIGTLLNKVMLEGFHQVIVVDDGSCDGTAEVARRHGATVLSHAINLGVGAATQTGISYAIELGASILVTIDADLQHLPEDIPAVVRPIIEGDVDLVVGSRFMKSSNSIPSSRIFYNKIANWITFFVTGILVSDSQSGFRAMTQQFAAARPMCCNGYEFCIEMIRNAAHLHAKVVEVPISVRYTRETMEKGQNIYEGMKMIGRILRLNFLSR